MQIGRFSQLPPASALPRGSIATREFALVRPVPARPADPDSHSPRRVGRAPWQKARSTGRARHPPVLFGHLFFIPPPPPPILCLSGLSFLLFLYRRPPGAFVFSLCRWWWWWARQGAAAPRRRAVHRRRRRGRGRPGAAPDQGAQEQGGGARGHARNAQAPGGRVRPLGGPREVLALRRSVILLSVFFF